jgi:hypothetical protein
MHIKLLPKYLIVWTILSLGLAIKKPGCEVADGSEYAWASFYAIAFDVDNVHVHKHVFSDNLEFKSVSGRVSKVACHDQAILGAGGGVGQHDLFELVELLEALVLPVAS